MATTDASSTHPNSAKIILVTGINGFIGSHIALQLLEKGYTVRGTSRSASTPQTLRAQPAFGSIPITSLQHVVVPDITAAGAFDTAVGGVHAIIHTASPLDWSLTTVEAYMGPAIGGVSSILQSAYEENRHRDGKIVSFVLTSSVGAVVDRWKHPPISLGGSENRAYTEADWNENGENMARESEKSGNFLPMVAYGASKVASERYMWKFVEEKKGEDDGSWVGPACAALCAGVTVGPPVNWPDSPEKLSETVRPIWEIWSGKSQREGKLPAQVGGATYIDVRDLARMHVWCMENPGESGGERYLMTNGKAPPQGTADVLRDVVFKDDEETKERIIVGQPGSGWVEGFGWPDDEPTLKATKAYKALGVERFMGYEESIRDTVMAIKERYPDQ